MKKIVLMILVALVAGACASMRGVNVGSDAGNSFALDVTNARQGSVTVSYTDAEGTARQLGTVAAGRTERFVVVASGAAVTVTARTGSGSVVGTYSVATTGGTQRLTIR